MTNSVVAYKKPMEPYLYTTNINKLVFNEIF